MNTENVNWLLGGSFECETDMKKTESLIETLSFFVGKFSMIRLEESDINDAKAFELESELSQMEDLLESIKNKVINDSLNEGDLANITIPSAISLIDGGFGMGKLLLNQWMDKGSIVPEPIQNAMRAVGNWLTEVTGSERAERREKLKEQFSKKFPNLSSTQLTELVKKIETEEYNKSKNKNKITLKYTDSREHKKHMEHKTKIDDIKKRFPNAGLRR